MKAFTIAAALTCFAGFALIGSARAQAPQTGAAPQDERLVEAQIENQQAQAEYYRHQSSAFVPFIPVVSGVSGALLGAIVAFLTLHLQAEKQAALEETKWTRARDDEAARWTKARDDEKERWERARDDDAQKWTREIEGRAAARNLERKDEREREARLAAADLLKRIAVATHTMTWVLWIARFTPAEFHETLLDDYYQKMNALYAELVASQVVLAALDESLSKKAQPLIDHIYSYDARLSGYGGKLKKNPANLEKLGALWEPVYKFSTKIPDAFRGAFELD